MGVISLKNKKVLITGGNGYLGSFLVEALKKEGAVVYIIDRITNTKKNNFNIDITDKPALEKAIKKINPDIVFHLAALLNRDRDFINHDKIMQVNYNGTMHLLQALQPIKYSNFIFISSSEVYGTNKVPFKEEMSALPTSPYSMSKAFAETAIQLFSDLHKKPFTIIRLFNFFGENMPTNFFIPQMLQALKKGATFKMTKGAQARDFLYIHDVINGLLLSAKQAEAKNEVFNLCSSKSITMRELVLEFKKELKSKSVIEFGALPYRENEIWNMVGNNDKIKKKLGFRPRYNVKEVIRSICKME